MKKPASKILPTLLFWFCSMAAAAAGPKNFQHVVVIVQENRTPDNLFQGLCTSRGICSTTPTDTQYNIQQSDWLDGKGTVHPLPVALANTYDLDHTHTAYNEMCDRDPYTGICLMDGAARVYCEPLPGTSCPATPQFRYVDNSTGILNPYLTLATEYGWANYMFQTNQGPSYPAHQFLFGATSARNGASDSKGIFASENPDNLKQPLGCPFAGWRRVQLIDAAGVEKSGDVAPTCFYHATMGDLLSENGNTWRYYATGANTIWNAPNSIEHICVPHKGSCTGASWRANVALRSTDVLGDVKNCALRQVSWVIPTAADSDHASVNNGEGPSWVASIVNAIGNSGCKNSDGTSYWDSTAILITWDDWGGWYDHAASPLIDSPQSGYQYGFRVPLIVVSAYTPKGHINNSNQDFGSIIKFLEHNFGMQEGALHFADSRGDMGDLTEFFFLSHKPRSFQTIPAPFGADYFVNDKRPPGAPDDD